MIRIKSVLQQGNSDCGVACIATILQFYGKNVSLRKIYEEAGTDSAGTSGLGIIKAAQRFGLSCTGIMISEKAKITSVPFPAIFHFKNGDYEHYVVPYKVKKNIVFYCDPARGYGSETVEEFNKKWSGIVFITYPSSNFEKGNESKGFFSRFLVLLRPYRKYIVETFIASIFLSFFGIFMALYFRFLIDEVLYSQVKSTLNLCSLCYLFVVLMQVLLNFCRSQLLTYLGSKVDVCLISDFFLHLLKLPLEFFVKRKTGEIREQETGAKRSGCSVSFPFSFSFFIFLSRLPVGKTALGGGCDKNSVRKIHSSCVLRTQVGALPRHPASLREGLTQASFLGAHRNSANLTQSYAFEDVRSRGHVT